MNFPAAPQQPEVQAAAVELERLGYTSVEPGWAVITLGIVRAAAAVHPELVPRFTAKWASMQVTFHPEDLAASLRVRLASAVLLSKTSLVTCQVCGKATDSDVDPDREIEKVLCADHQPVTAGVPQCPTKVRRIGGAVRRAIRRVPGSATVANFYPGSGRR